MQKQFYTVQEFAKITGLHPQSIYSMIYGGKIRARRFGAAWRIPASELDPDVNDSAGNQSAGGPDETVD
jgi:excisionase family DNA binding protein